MILKCIQIFGPKHTDETHITNILRHLGYSSGQFMSFESLMSELDNFDKLFFFFNRTIVNNGKINKL